ncbi:MAG: thioredoxin family protein [Prevotella sp.]
MKKIILSLIAALACHSLLYAQGVAFMEAPLKKVLERAKASNKLVFIDCYTSWCIPCANMARNIFPTKACGDYMNPLFVCTKYDMEKGEGAQLQQTFKCIAYPTFIILNADGKEIGRLTGASTTAETFVEKVKTAISPDNSMDSLQARYEAAKGMQTGLPYAKALYDRGHNIAQLLEDIYLNSQEYDRYNTEFLTYYLNCTDFRSPMFDRLLLDKQMWNQRLGREAVDRMIFDSYRKTMYLVAAGRPHNLSADDVRKAAMLTAMLAIPENSSERFLPNVALFVMTHDWDRFIDLYARRILPMADDPFKAIIMGFLSQYYAQFDTQQRARADQMLERAAANRSYASKTMQELYHNIRK